MREALFSVLGDLTDAAVLDLYAGSGALAIEALSRGAARAVCVEQAAAAVACIRHNLRELELDTRCTVLATDVRRAARALTKMGPFDVVLADPPWADTTSAQAIAALLATDGVVAPDAIIAVEHASRDEPPAFEGRALDRTRKYGDTAISLFR